MPQFKYHKLPINKQSNVAKIIVGILIRGVLITSIVLMMTAYCKKQVKSDEQIDTQPIIITVEPIRNFRTEEVTELIAEEKDIIRSDNLMLDASFTMGDDSTDIYVDADLFEDRYIILMAKLLYGECRGMQSLEQKSAVLWCVLNRCDAWHLSIDEVILQENQFHCGESFPIEIENVWLAADVLNRYRQEKDGNHNSGRTLPSDYLWFYGLWAERGLPENEFRNTANRYSSDANMWDWSLNSPYTNMGDYNERNYKRLGNSCS